LHLVRRILVVKDSADLRRYFRVTLQMAGYDVAEATDGARAPRD
jgi:DNA-binding response OmpR family regulator